MSDSGFNGNKWVLIVLLAIAISAVQVQDKSPSATTALKTDDTNLKAPLAQGEIVSNLGSGVMYVFQAANSDYWFDTNDRGVYRYDGKLVVNFTTNVKLCNNRIRGIQEDKSGNIYFTVYEGINEFDG